VCFLQGWKFARNVSILHNVQIGSRDGVEKDSFPFLPLLYLFTKVINKWNFTQPTGARPPVSMLKTEVVHVSASETSVPTYRPARPHSRRK
jgi:hypothetical protein